MNLDDIKIMLASCEAMLTPLLNGAASFDEIEVTIKGEDYAFSANYDADKENWLVGVE